MTDRTIDARVAATLEEIDVLLVDDNERWATFMAEELERREPSLRVESVCSANEALAVFAESSIDCLVVDYRLPETNGIELVVRLRDERPQLPIVLVTGEGSETVATRAIDAGVTDYLPKDPTVDQAPILAGKIHNAVERRALRRAIEDSEQRYRSVIEQSRDAIVIVRDGRLLFCNRRFAEFAGSTATALVGTAFVDRFVHEADRRRFREIDTDVLADGIHYVRLVTDGRVAHCEYTGRTIAYDEEPATMLSIRDVTEKRLREVRHLRERNINRRVQRALVTAERRVELERAVVAALAQQEYELVWIGAAADGELRPQAVAGDQRYVDAVDRSLDGTEHECEPSVWAARTGTIQAIADFEALFPAAWRELALECGLRTGIALPVGYEDVTHGVLAAYRGEPESIDNAERELLEELAATVGYAITHLGARRALTAGRGVEARIELREGTHYLSEIVAGDADDSTLEPVVRGTHAGEDNGVVQYVTLQGGSAERFRDAASAHSTVRGVVPIDSHGSEAFRLTVDGPTPESTLAPFNALVRSTSIAADRSVMRIELPSRGNLSALVDSLADRYGRVSVLSCVEREWTPEESHYSFDAGVLTEKQAIALEAAYRHGYFEQPRRSSATEIATALGVSHSTYLQHLHAAQQKVFTAFYE
ncbi:bacterio-opsin activator domain-containing protein [Natronococcus occultus]|uniref:Response regulator with CheY-like receiver, AAA-type ATPase, and DNA-binding domains n=1 Tax=Natronococcus occultus SP4 TaxID=694430 RepID=L0K7B1_9EURY|nr:bacterio-opsin activator domain-containing protein [Natronococcus occultus]AGB40008.1 response regulator with CheY-like receiver, AAA-type ATPase, and DNA-binding domains [Natronococcus occultus SP4]